MGAQRQREIKRFQRLGWRSFWWRLVWWWLGIEGGQQSWVGKHALERFRRWSIRRWGIRWGRVRRFSALNAERPKGFSDQVGATYGAHRLEQSRSGS